jgi:Cof subfamily protein (haloacid dehalogenase superfamily)
MSKKIKYFVCDVDGTTLMPGEGAFSARTVDAFNKILNSGNKIIVASGRTYANLKFLFNNNKDIIYLCENGSLVVEDDRDLIVHKMKEEDVKSLFDYYSAFDGLIIEMCTPHMAYFVNRSKINEKDFITGFNSNCMFVKTVDDIKEPIIKFSIYREKKDSTFEKWYQYTAKEYKGKVEIFDANNAWIDYSPLNVSKGNVLKEFVKTKKIPLNSLYVFGDAENDISMLSLTDNSYCNSNGLEAAKKVSKNLFSDFNDTVELIINDK